MAALVQPAPASLSSNLTAQESIGLNNKITKCIYRMSDPKRSKLFVAHYSGPSTLHRNERGVELGLIGNEKQRTKLKSRYRNGRSKDGAGVSTVAMSTLDS